jgi:hypothetical protein
MKRIIIVADLNVGECECLEDVADLVSCLETPEGRKLWDVTIYGSPDDLLRDCQEKTERVECDLPTLAKLKTKTENAK